MEIPTADTLRKRSKQIRKEQCDSFLEHLKETALDRLIDANNHGYTEWNIPIPFHLWDKDGKEFFLNGLTAFFVPLGYTIINHEPLSNYISISWKEA